MEVLKYFSENIRDSLIKNIKVEDFENVEEIRIRCNKRIYVKTIYEYIVIDYIVSSEDILKTLALITENSVYSYQNQICNGYITLNGGHRVGISGNVSYEDKKVLNINYVYSLSFRIAKQIPGSSNKIQKYVIFEDEKKVFNTLIVGIPGSGKTTILKDLIRIISTNKNFVKNIGIVDERGEISSMYKGQIVNDLGERVDVLENIPKSIGMKMLIRSMSPDIIVADEIGGIDDSKIINYAICSGVTGIFTAHGSSLKDIMKNPELFELINKHVFERIIILSKSKKGEIEEVYNLSNGRDYVKIY